MRDLFLNGVLPKSKLLLFFYFASAAATTAATGRFVGAASAAVGAADAFFAAFFRFINIEDGGTENQSQHGDDDYICHEMISTPF